MAYSPLGEGDLLRDRKLKTIATSIGATPAQVALAFLLSRPGVVAIPKAANPGHLRENLGALSLKLDETTRQKLDAAFPAPSGPSRISIV